MRIINKKHLLIILLMGVIITGVIIFKPKENVKLDNVILKQKVNNKTFAMYTETDDGYKEYNNNKFPDMYVLNINESKCIDNNGKEVDNILSFNNGEVTITSGKTIYCYLYFDKTLGVEIKEKEPKGLSTDEIRGAMYRYQGQAKDENGNELVENYICFGTSDKDTCTTNQDKYMYRVIGLEAETGRAKVIKMKALKDTYTWGNSWSDNIEFPNSKIYEAIKGDGFLTNIEYVPEGWENKISDNTWTYGDYTTSQDGHETGSELYLIENGKKESNWFEKSDSKEEGTKETTIEGENYGNNGETFYYKELQEKWQNTLESKISLMYLHDYKYSVSDSAICSVTAKDYNNCKTGWMHLSQNDPVVNGDSSHEWTMTRVGWNPTTGIYYGKAVNASGITNGSNFQQSFYVRPVFYIKASEELLGGEGTITDPFIIK